MGAEKGAREGEGDEGRRVRPTNSGAMDTCWWPNGCTVTRVHSPTSDNNHKDTYNLIRQVLGGAFILDDLPCQG